MYKVIFYNHSGSVYLNLFGWDRLEFTQRMNFSWNHSLQIRVPRGSEIASTLRNMPKDTQVRIYKTDEVYGTTFLAYEGLNQTASEQLQTDNNLFFNLYGVGYTKLLERRLIYPPYGLENDKRTGVAEDLMKGYVVSNCIADESRYFPGFSVVASENRGKNVEYTARYVNLFSAMETLSSDGGLYFGVEGGQELSHFVFDARPLWGEDKRYGRPNQVIFDLERGNMDIPILSTNGRLEKNVMIMAGAGQGTNRIILEVPDITQSTASPWARSELFVEALEETSTSALTALALQTIKERGSQTNFSFDLVQTTHTRWGIHWKLGDLVSAFYEGLQFDKMINEVMVVVTASESSKLEETITVELQDVFG